MAKRGEDRREKILEVAEAIILQQGFAATSIEDILKAAHITKGGFFYHFQGKLELAKALVQRYLDADEQLFRSLNERANTLSEDPLQQMLIFMNLMAETMENHEDVHPGCLVASFTYESQQVDDEVKALIQSGILRWRAIFREKLAAISEVYSARLDISLDELADLLSSVIEGGIILSRVLHDKMVLVAHLKQYRNYIRLLFS